MSDEIFYIDNGLVNGIVAPSILVGQPNGWYFWEDGGVFFQGPFVNFIEAEEHYEKYCESVLDFSKVKSRVVNKGKGRLL